MQEQRLEITRKKLFDDSMETTKYYCSAAIQQIDSFFGDGYAKAHPELIGSLVETMSREYSAGTVAMALQVAAKDIQLGSQMIASILESK